MFMTQMHMPPDPHDGTAPERAAPASPHPRKAMA
jgi:hypothetical protein